MPQWIATLRRIVTVEPVLSLYMICTFSLTTIYQNLIITKVCLGLFDDPDICRGHRSHQQEIQAKSSLILLLSSVILSLASIPSVLLLGSWSDHVGRRIVLAIPSLLSLPASAIFIMVDKIQTMSMYWSVLGIAFVGFSGSYIAIYITSFSYLADVTDDSNRTRRMAVAESMASVGSMIGFLLGGLLVQEYGTSPAFGFYLACHVAILLYIALWLRDSPAVRESPSSKEVEGQEGGEVEVARPRLLILHHTKRSLVTVFRQRPGQERFKLLLLILCSFINTLVLVGEESILLLFLKYKPRNFTTLLYGVYSSVKMLLMALFLLGGLPLLLRCFNQMTVAKISAIFRIASFILMAFSKNTWMVFLVALLTAPSSITQVVVRSLCSAIVGPDEQGAMFSFSASLEATCILVSATIFNGLYTLTLPSFPGMPFIVIAGFTLIQIIFLQWISEMPATQARVVLQD